MIRYDKQLRNKIDNTVNRYNSKINRVKKGEYSESAPEKETYLNIIHSFKNRKDLVRYLNSLESFIKKGGEKPVTYKGKEMPQYLATNIENYERLLKRRSNQIIKKAENTKPTTEGRTLFSTLAENQDERYLTAKARQKLIKDDLSELSQKDLNNLQDLLISNTRTPNLNLWKNNYLDIIDRLALTYDYDKEKLLTIKNKIEKMSPTEFDNEFYINRDFQALLYSYYPLEKADKKIIEGNRNAVIDNLDILFEDLKN